MDRNTLIGFGLIVLILFGYMWWTAPSKEQIARAKREQDSLAQVQIEEKARQAQLQVELHQPGDTAAPAAVVKPTDPKALAIVNDTTINDSARTARLDSLQTSQDQGRFGIFLPSASGEAQTLVIENENVQVSLSTHGAQPQVIRLKNYTTYHGQPLVVADPDTGQYEFRFFLGNIDLSTRELFFHAEKKDPRSVRLVARTTDPAQALAITYTLDSGGFFMRTQIELIGLEKQVDPGNLFFHWDLFGLNNEKYLPAEQQKSTVFFKYMNDDRNYLSETKDDEKELEGRTNWVAFKQDFFSAAVISDQGFASNGSEIKITMLTDTVHNKRYTAKLFFEADPAEHVTIPFRFYFGPNHFGTLRRTEIPQFDRIIDLGWGIFGWMNRFLVIPIFNFLGKFNLSYGIIILVLTIVIKLLLMPLTYRNQRASTRMRVLRPEMEAINEKHKDSDALKKQQATMELYRKAGVNPAAGCWPMLIQLPILYAMFRFFPASIELRQQKFLWAEDLSSYDSILNLPFTVPMYGDHISLFTLLMCISTIVYTVINSKQMPTQQGMPSMKLMMYLFPVMMLLFMNNFSAGLSYYYLLANVISILQMTVLSRFFIDEDKLRAELLENMKKPRKKSRWQMRLEDLQKQQQSRRK